MKLLRQCAMTASLICLAGASASAQYYPYAAPAMLPAPTNQPRYLAWQEPGYPGTHAPHNYSAPHNYAAPPSTAQPGHGYYPSAAGGGYSGYQGLIGGCGPQWHQQPPVGGDCFMPSNPCQDCAPSPCCGPCWFGGVAALYMTRNEPNPFQISFDTADPIGELILNRDSLGDWRPGIEARIGRYLGPQCAVEFTFWTLEGFGGEAYAQDPDGNINTPFDFRSLSFGNDPVTQWFDNAQAHRHRRDNDLYNFELNLIHWPVACDPCARTRLSFLGGVRYFRFDENWLLASADSSTNFGDEPSDEAYWNIAVENHLVGGQVGARLDYRVWKGLSLFAAPKFGVFVNSIEHQSSILSGDGITALNIRSDKEVFSMIGQLDAGLNFQIFGRCSGYVGYRVVAVSGVALSDEQIPFLQDDLFGIGDIDHNANLVLHGGMAGLQYNY